MKNHITKILLLFIFSFVTGVVNAQDIVVSTGIDGQTFVTCNSFIIDSGGQGGPGYSNGEDITFTICSDTPGDMVSVTFNLFDLDPTDTNPNPNQSNADQMYVFDGPNTSANTLGNYGGGGLQGVVIQATPQNPSGCLTFQFVSNNQGTGMFAGSASCNTPCATPFADGEIIGGITPDSIRTCVGELVTFQELNSISQPGFNLVSYTWDFMDGNSETVTANNAQVQHAFSQPGHYLVQLFVQDDNPDNICLNTNFISLDVLVATIPDFIGFQEDAELCVGEELHFLATPELYEVTWDGFEGSTEIENGCLPDTLLGISQNIQIYQTGFLAGTSISDVSQIHEICLDMEHSFMGDLVIYVTCPNGQQIMLHQQGGGGTQIGEPNGADNIDCDDPSTQGVPYHYCFTPDATETWVEWVNNSGFGGTLPEDAYEPIEPFDSLVGCPTNGIWTLTVIDNWAADDGQLFGFSMTLDASLYPEATVFTPQILPGPATSYWASNMPYASINDNNLDEITIIPEAAGEYTYVYTVVDDFGCTNDTSFTVSVFEALQVSAPADLFYACDTLILQGWFEGLPTPSCSDCGEFNYCYDDGSNFQWNFCPDNPGDGTVLSFSFISGLMEGFFETLTVYDGANTSAPVLAVWNTGDATGQSWTATNPDGCLTITFTSDGSVSCGGGSYNEWTYSVSPGGPTYEWSWTPATFLDDASIQAPSVTDLTQQTTYTVIGYPVGHPDCASSDEVTVFLDPVGDPGLDNNITICSTDAPFDMVDQLEGTPSSNGTWMDGTGNQLADGMFDPMTDAAGNYQYTVQNGSCEASAVLTIALAGPTVISIPNDTLICALGSVKMDLYDLDSGQPEFIYTWTYDGNTVSNQANDVYSPENSGEVCLTVLDACDYSVTDCFSVEVKPAIEVVFTADTTSACYPTAFVLTNQVDPTIFNTSLWEINDGISYNNENEITHVFANPGTYTVKLTLTNELGCAYDATYDNYLTSFSPPVAGYIAEPQPTDITDTEIYFSDETIGAEIAAYDWTFLDAAGQEIGHSSLANPMFEFPDDYGGIYSVLLEVTDVNGCTDVITPGIIDINDLLQFYVPNAFTPNGDGVNDILFFEGADIDPERFSLKIFSRFGDKVFETTDPTLPWIGDVRGGEYYAPNGVYNWMAVIVSISTGERMELKGHVTLIR